MGRYKIWLRPPWDRQLKKLWGEGGGQSTMYILKWKPKKVLCRRPFFWRSQELKNQAGWSPLRARGTRRCPQICPVIRKWKLFQGCQKTFILFVTGHTYRYMKLCKWSSQQIQLPFWSWPVKIGYIEDTYVLNQDKLHIDDVDLP